MRQCENQLAFLKFEWLNFEFVKALNAILYMAMLLSQ